MPDSGADGERRERGRQARSAVVGAGACGRAGGWLRPRRAVILVLVLVAAAAGVAVGVGALSGGAGRTRAAVTVRVGGIPLGLAVDDEAGVVYVAAGPAGLVVLQADACRAGGESGCHARRAPVAGQSVTGVAVDPVARTVYLAESAGRGAAGSVAVISTAACGAGSVRGCSRPVAVISMPGVPQALALDQRTGTLYVSVSARPSRVPPAGAGPAGRLVVVSVRACGAAATRGCGAAFTVPLGQGPAGALAVDAATGTVYAAVGTGLDVINGRACAAGDARGCARDLAVIPVDGYASSVTVAGGVVYLTSPVTSAVTVLRTAACGVQSIAGCARGARLRAGAGPLAAAADPPARTVYVADEATNTVSMISLAACGPTGAGCPPSPPAFPVGAAPGTVVADPATRTLYVGNLTSRSVSVISTTACDAVAPRGCPTQAPPGTPAIPRTPTTCDPAIAAYQSGQPAGPFTRTAIRVAAGVTGGQPWSVWAKKNVPAPYGVEQGGLVIRERWYALCSGPLNGGTDAASMKLIDTPGHGVAYGYIQHPARVRVALGVPGNGLLPAPTVVPLRGTTFFIETLPGPACAYHSLGVRGQAPGWGGVSVLGFGVCQPSQLVQAPDNNGIWGPRTGPR